MTFTTKQTRIIVYELVLIFLGTVALLRNRPAVKTSAGISDQNISTVTISAIYGSQKKSYSPARPAEEKKQEQPVTVTFDPKDSIYGGGDSGRNSRGSKYRKSYGRKSSVENIDMQ